MGTLKHAKLAKMLARRMVQVLIVLFCISFITFYLTYLAPGNPATAMFEAAGISPTEEQLANAMEQMGLNRPFLEQYFIWLTNCLQGEFGQSFSNHTAVLGLLKTRLIPTIKLALLSLAMMLVAAVPLGILSAVYRGKAIDVAVRVISFFGISMPGFWLGLILMYVFALKLRLLPVIASPGSVQQMLLPALTLAIAMASKYMRQVRTAFLEELSQDYVTGARARGANETIVLWRHVLPNAMLPLITLLGLSLGSLLGGTAVVEIIFSYPGLGNLAVNAVGARDYPLIQGFVLWVALIYMVINLIVDLSYSLVDPRIREAA